MHINTHNRRDQAVSDAFLLKDKSGVGIIVDYSRDCIVVNGA